LQEISTKGQTSKKKDAEHAAAGLALNFLAENGLMKVYIEPSDTNVKQLQSSSAQLQGPSQFTQVAETPLATLILSLWLRGGSAEESGKGSTKREH